MRFRRLFLVGLSLGAAVACTETPGYQYSNPAGSGSLPSSAVPTTALTGTQSNPASQSNLSCGLNGSFGLCSTDSTGLTFRDYIVITGCSHLEYRTTYYLNAGCKDADQFYERREYYNMVATASPVVSGAQAVDLTMTFITESISPATYASTNWQQYIHCEAATDTFPNDPTQSFVPVTCFSSDLSRLSVPSLTVYQVLKQVDGGLYWGTLCADEAAWGYCLVAGDRPTALDTSGFPNWQ